MGVAYRWKEEKLDRSEEMKSKFDSKFQIACTEL
jgi:hypothetical protein